MLDRTRRQALTRSAAMMNTPALFVGLLVVALVPWISIGFI